MIQGADRSMAMDFLFHLCESYKIKSWGTSWEYFRQYKQLYASVTGQYMDRNDSKEILKVRYYTPSVMTGTDCPIQWQDAVLVHRFGLVAPNGGGKDVADSGDLLALQTFNIAYDTGVFSGERHRIQLAGCYLGLAFTGARPAEFVDGERKSGKDGCLEELFPRKPRVAHEEDGTKALEPSSGLLEDILAQEYASRGRPKALCYEDILLMVVRHPNTSEDVLAMSIKFAHHKGADNNPKP